MDLAPGVANLLQGPLNGSALATLLQRWRLVDAPAQPTPFVDGLTGWLGWADTIPLAAALQAAPLPAPARPLDPAALAAELQRLREHLAQQIQQRTAADPRADETDPDTHRRRHQALQQTMDTAIAPLRQRLRTALAQRSPALARVAALDALWAQVLAPREQALLALLPALMERHFERLHQAQPASTALPRFRQDLQQLLLAERDQRLLPLQGLRDALPRSITSPAHA